MAEKIAIFSVGFALGMTAMLGMSLYTLKCAADEAGNVLDKTVQSIMGKLKLVQTPDGPSFIGLHHQTDPPLIEG